MPQRKKCSKCGEVKPVDRFSKQRRRKDGLQSQCKDCNRRYRENNREALLKRKRLYYKENREAAIERRRLYYEENREAVRERNHRYYEDNREALLKRKRRYRDENLEAERECSRRYREESRDISREVATRNGMPWTEAEDSFILSTDMTYLEAAVELGRTDASVRGRKHRLRKNLQTI